MCFQRRFCICLQDRACVNKRLIEAVFCMPPKIRKNPKEKKGLQSHVDGPGEPIYRRRNRLYPVLQPPQTSLVLRRRRLGPRLAGSGLLLLTPRRVPPSLAPHRRTAALLRVTVLPTRTTLLRVAPPPRLWLDAVEGTRRRVDGRRQQGRGSVGAREREGGEATQLERGKEEEGVKEVVLGLEL